MMYVAGDGEEPDIHTAEFIEVVVREEIRKLCCSLGRVQKISWLRPNVLKSI